MMTAAPNKSTKSSIDFADTPRKVLNTELGNIYIYDQYVIMEGKENVNISIRNGMPILLKVVKAVGLRSVVYISNRINTYSVDPNDYKYLEMIPNLTGIAVVAYNDYAANTAMLEEKFFRKPFKVFTSMNDAKKWANYVIEGLIIV
ncbi:MAG: hypothetical protein KJO39_12570 [Bacteroidia bacterium]|nr:hypothetical protein [Bacteroidia bacterium]NNJ81776.1 hypothetical protein [Flavobacteriaceae bacterium]NNK55296.1 hypothetical protein [Flavobacteriaceae bacterium]